MPPARRLKSDVVLNLDALEREQKDIKPEFKVVLEDREIVFADPSELDWAELAALESPGDFIDFCLSKEDRDFLYEQKVPAWKFRILWESYQAHFGLDQRGNARA